MQLSSTLIARFQQAYLEEFGDEISPESAERDLLDLAQLVRVVQQTEREDSDG